MIDGGRATYEAETVAASTAAALTSLFAELRPLVGTLATQALLRRAVHLSRAPLGHHAGGTPSLDEQIELLREELAHGSRADALRSSEALLRAFVDLLLSLIGRRLTFRLVLAAWGMQIAATYFEETAP